MSMKLLYRTIQSEISSWHEGQRQGQRNETTCSAKVTSKSAILLLLWASPKYILFESLLIWTLTLGQLAKECQRQTFDQVGPLYIVWSSGQVVDDFVHYQGWMSKNCTPSRWNTWRRDLGNGVVRASRRHRRTRMRHPTLLGCVACWFGLRFGVQAYGVLRWHLKAFHHISPILLSPTNL